MTDMGQVGYRMRNEVQHRVQYRVLHGVPRMGMNKEHRVLHRVFLRVLQSVQYALRAVGALFYPHCCAACGRLLEDPHEAVCKDCLQRLPRTEHATLRFNQTEELFTDILHFGHGASFLFYEKNTPVQRMFHRMKYMRQPEIASVLAREAACDFLQTDFFEGIDLIIPIPLHPKRLRRRGYNQSDYIARALSEATGIPYDTTHLVRIRNNPQQALMKGKDRERNVQGIFRVHHPEELYRKHILIVDDLITTGSTVRSAMTALKVCRGATYSVFSLGKAR